MKIIISGGGIGGLALAAGLRRHDIDVEVYERDTDPAATGGYHITLDGRAQTALRRLIDPAAYEQLLASASALRLREPDAFFDRRGRLLGTGPSLSGDPGIDVDRVTLRVLLAEAAGDSLRLGACVTGVGTADGRPYATLADGRTATGDLVVGADGPHSIVARHLAGGPTNAPAGIVGFSGRTDAGALTAAEQQRLGRRSSTAIGPRGAALYVGFLDPVGNAVLDAPDQRRSVSTGPTYIWGAMFPESPRTDALRTAAGTDLRDGLITTFRRHGWAEDSLEVIARTEPDSVAGFRFNAASRRAEGQAPWPAGRITALGDAVHATPPTAGMGAGAAIRDAADLLDGLLEVRAGRSTVPTAVHACEETMRVRGAEVLTLAMRTVDQILITDTRAGAALTTVALPVLAAAHRLRPRRAARRTR